MLEPLVEESGADAERAVEVEAASDARSEEAIEVDERAETEDDEGDGHEVCVVVVQGVCFGDCWLWCLL